MLVRGNFEGPYVCLRRAQSSGTRGEHSRTMAGPGHDPDHFASLKHEERTDPLLRHRLRRHLRQGCEAIVYSAWPSRAR